MEIDDVLFSFTNWDSIVLISITKYQWIKTYFSQPFRLLNYIQIEDQNQRNISELKNTLVNLLGYWTTLGLRKFSSFP